MVTRRIQMTTSPVSILIPRAMTGTLGPKCQMMLPRELPSLETRPGFPLPLLCLMHCWQMVRNKSASAYGFTNIFAAQDNAMKNLLMSWYYAGYYTGLYEGKQQGFASALGQQEGG